MQAAAVNENLIIRPMLQQVRLRSEKNSYVNYAKMRTEVLLILRCQGTGASKGILVFQCSEEFMDEDIDAVAMLPFNIKH